jgi:hypothetical protein
MVYLELGRRGSTMSKAHLNEKPKGFGRSEAKLLSSTVSGLELDGDELPEVAELIASEGSNLQGYKAEAYFRQIETSDPHNQSTSNVSTGLF